MKSYRSKQVLWRERNTVGPSASWMLGGTVHCWVLANSSRATTEKTWRDYVFSAHSLFLWTTLCLWLNRHLLKRVRLLLYVLLYTFHSTQMHITVRLWPETSGCFFPFLIRPTLDSPCTLCPNSGCKGPALHWWFSFFIVSVGNYCICHSLEKNGAPWLLHKQALRSSVCCLIARIHSAERNVDSLEKHFRFVPLLVFFYM